MAEQDTSREDKQLPASERKLKQAREDGQVARSRDFGHLMVLGTTLACVAVLGGYMAGQAQSLMRGGLQLDWWTMREQGGLGRHLMSLAGQGLSIVYPVGLVGILGGIASAVVPGGLVLTSKPLKPKWERLSPLAGIKRLLGRAHLVDSIKLSVLVAVLTAIAAAHVWAQGERIITMFHVPLAPALGMSASMILVGAALLLLLLVVVAFVDVPLVWFRHRADMRMTHQEARKEHRESEGDPQLRARIRERQRNISRGRMMTQVPTADVIVNNPTHYSVALSYRDGEMSAPRVVAKGADQIAMRIRELARQAGVPQLEAPALARALYAHVELDHEVPSALYSAVAQVLAYVHRLRHLRPGMPEPSLPVDLPVPAGLDPAAAATTDGAH
ncbi:MAG: EscU/YscU/HrcU family type III secretion system export apparatus switch protein [Burkholderiaceae bacterium]